MVTSRLRPLDVKLIFEDRPYKLGETIDLTAELDARSDVEVREGRVDLVCEERWKEIYTVMVPVARPLSSERGAVYVPPKVPKQVTKEFRETYVHSSVVFLQDTRLDSTTRGSYRASLEIEPEIPPHAAEATVRWKLVAAIDVTRARDIKTRRAVQVTVD